MSNRKRPVSVPHGEPRQYHSVEGLIAGAAGHARNRLLHACEAVAWVGGLALQQRRQHAAPRFSLEAARVQDATAKAGEQAAHVLLGQLLIDGAEPWALAAEERMKVGWLARFMATSAVPAPFNRADSAAEQAGLKDAFRAACERAWSRAAGGARDLGPTYAEFLAAADRAFRAAEAGKRGRSAAAADRGAQATGDERLVESLLLRMYRAHGVTADEASRRFPLRQGGT